MKAEELMIGDWVAFRGRPLRYTAQDIATMAECEEKGIATDTTPIPITPEILQKSGFGFIERDEKLTHFYLGKGHICSNMDIHIGTNNYRFWVNNYMSNIFGLYFVHELQHAFRILGIEKEVVL